MQIEGGNWRIFANMLKESKADVRLRATIQKISKQKDSTYQLTNLKGHNMTFDEVVLAAPLQFTDLTIDPPPRHTPDEIPYTKLYTTLFASPHQLDPTAFNIVDGSPVPQYVLTTLPPTEKGREDAGSPGFYSISIHNSFVNLDAHPPRAEYIYKIFSPMRINSTFLSNILGHKVTTQEADHGNINGTVSWIYHKIWYSYPKEYPRVTFEEIMLDEGLWYTSGMESFISTMETSALSGKNVARLMRDAWLAGTGEERNAGKDAKSEGWKMPDLGLMDEVGGEEIWQEEL